MCGWGSLSIITLIYLFSPLLTAGCKKKKKSLVFSFLLTAGNLELVWKWDEVKRGHKHLLGRNSFRRNFPLWHHNCIIYRPKYWTETFSDKIGFFRIWIHTCLDSYKHSLDVAYCGITNRQLRGQGFYSVVALFCCREVKSSQKYRAAHSAWRPALKMKHVILYQVGTYKEGWRSQLS